MRYLAPILGAAGINLVTSFLISQMFEAPPATKEIQGFFEAPYGFEQYLTLFILVIMLPILEEWIFRSVLWKFLNKYMSLDRTFIAVSMLFALCHVQLPVVLGLLPFSFFLGYLRKTQGSIEGSTLAHITHNLVGVLVTLL